MHAINKCGCVRFSKKTGKIDTTLTGLGNAMMQLWALQNTTKAKASIVFDLEERKPVMECVGTANGFPEVRKDPAEFQFDFPDELYDELLKNFEERGA